MNDEIQEILKKLEELKKILTYLQKGNEEPSNITKKEL